MKFLAAAGVAAAWSLPAAALAAPSTSTTLLDFITGIKEIVNAAIPVVLSLGLLVFLWGLVRFIAKAGDENAQEEGRKLMVWGVITLFVMVSVWGLVGLLNQVTGIPQGGQGTIPQL